MTDKLGTQHNWITSAQAADYLQLSVQTIRRMVLENTLHGIKLGKKPNSHLRISRESVEGLMDARPKETQ